MPDKLKFISGAIFALVVAHDIKTRIEAKKAAELYLLAHHEFVEDQQANEAKIKYLCHLLDEHEVPADEFDLIVLNFNQ